MASLIDQYGEDEAARIWNLWMLDVGWMSMLSLAQDGWSVWASEKGFGHFEVIGARITIRSNSANAELYEFQGQGGYLLTFGASS